MGPRTYLKLHRFLKKGVHSSCNEVIPEAGYLSHRGHLVTKSHGIDGVHTVREGPVSSTRKLTMRLAISAR